MKDEIQNLIDLIGALAEDIEAVKAKLDAKDASDKDEAVKRLAVKLEEAGACHTFLWRQHADEHQ